MRLARLLNTATKEEESSLQRLRKNLPTLNPVVPRIRGQGDESLLLDSEVQAALDDWSNSLHDTERNEFEPPDGSRWQRLQGYLETYRALLDQLGDIGDGLTRIRIRPRGHWDLTEAPILEPMLALVQGPGGLANADDLRRRKAHADAEAPRLQAILEVQRLLLAVWGNAPALRTEAEAQLRRLWRAAGDLAIEKANATDLYDRSQKAATPPSEPPSDLLPVPAARAPARPGGPPAWPQRAVRRRSPRLAAAAGALVLVAALLIAVAFLGQFDYDAPVRPTLDLKEPSAMAVNLAGLVVLLVLGVPAVLIVQRLVRKRDRERLRGEDEVSLRQALRWRDTAYACLSGLLVILSGMSLVYAADATFGTPGDYLTILLWGTAVTEGLVLAKSLLPSPFS